MADENLHKVPGRESHFGLSKERFARADLLCVQCKVCMTLALRTWEKANPEKVKATSQKAYQRHKEKRDASNKKWAAENPERRKEIANKWARANYTPEKGAKWATENPERAKENGALWRKKNPDKNTEKENRRRAGKLHATPPWADQEKIALVYRRAAALTKLTGVKYHVDHIAPLKSKLVCGFHVHENLRVLRGDRNIAKGNKFNPMTFGV